nr:uncharacterized protein LOC109780829 [Aegilops tauschii subsp. strangulata]
MEAKLPKEYSSYSNWVMYFDCSKMLAGLGAGIILTFPTGDTVRYVLQIIYADSNNAAEYEALLHGLRMAVSMGIQHLEVRGNSNLAISQVSNSSKSVPGSLDICIHGVEGSKFLLSKY